jgi:Asp-tRNA(Asn)/Glu-tRNA(Gln) amidotransferase A subunit family amidase
VGGLCKTRGAGFGPEPRRSIMLGTYVLSAGYYDAYYGKAITARAQLADEVAAALESRCGSDPNRTFARQKLEKNLTRSLCIARHLYCHCKPHRQPGYLHTHGHG